jgi:trans-aconitate methyltransferase
MWSAVAAATAGYDGSRICRPGGGSRVPHAGTHRTHHDGTGGCGLLGKAVAAATALHTFAARTMRALMDASTFAARYDATILEPRMARLYGSSGYFNVGYWVDGVTELVAACDRMVDEIVRVVPEDAALIVDVGCGLGAGTSRVAARFPRARVVGANVSVWQLAATRTRGVEATVATDAARMGVGGGIADAVLAMESAQHFDTRAEFFGEAYRVLRPGGMLSTADMLFRDQTIGPWMLPEGNVSATPEDYARELREAGFVDVTVRDITAVSWTPFCEAMRTVFEEHQEGMRRAYEQSLAYYVLATARRP